MSQIIRLTSKKVFIKAKVNEQYLLLDESGKSPSKIKMIKKGNNLEVLEEGKSEASLVIEDYYAPNMNNTLAGVDTVSKETFTYSVSQTDGWSYMNLDTGFDFLSPLGLGIGAAGAIGIAIVANNKGGSNDDGGSSSSKKNTSKSVAVSEVPDNYVEGTVTLGPILGSGRLTVNLYSTNGTLLGKGDVDENGKYSINVKNYKGSVIAQLVNKDTSQVDYKDEATGLDKNLVTDLLAFNLVSASKTILNINPLTTMATNLAGVTSSNGVILNITSFNSNSTANKDIADKFALNGNDITKITPTPAVDITGAVQTPNDLGVVLAALSGMDAIKGSTYSTMNDLLNDIKTNTEVREQLFNGVLVADSKLSGSGESVGLVDKLSNLLAAASSTNESLNINSIATNNIVDATEVTNPLNLVGKIPIGTTSVTIKLDNGTAKTATINSDGTWSLTVPGSSLGEGTHKYTVVATLLNGTTATASRLFVVNASDDVPMAVTFANEITTFAENTSTTTHIKVADIVVADVDGGTNSLALTGTDASHFEIVGTELFLKAGEVLNYETQSSYNISVTANGGATPATVSSQAVTVNLTNVNEAPTVVGTISTQTAVKNQNVWNLDLSTYFADVDAGDTKTYSLTSGTLPTGLTLNSSTGIISGTPIGEMTSSSYTVKMTDAAGLNITQTFNLQVVSAPVVQSFTVVDAIGTTTLGRSGESVNFVVTMSEPVTSTGTLTAHFSINGQDVTATATAVTNSSTITFTGTVPSSGNGTSISLTSLVADSGTIIGQISNQPIVAPTSGVKTYSGYTVDTQAPTITSIYSVAENSTNVSLIGTDANGPIVWSNLTGTDASSFTLNSDGTLTFTGTADYETKTNYTVSVTGTDVVGNGTTQAVTVNLTNVNEAPTVSSTAISDVTITTNSTTTLTTPIINMSTYFTDPENGTLTYSLASGAPTWLAIDSATGKVYNTTVAPATSSDDLAITVNVTDGENIVSKSFNIDVVDLPALTSTQNLDGVTNLDVRSGVVLSFNQAINLGTGHIKIYDDNGTLGWNHINTTTKESKQDISDNDVDITVVNGVATAVTIGGVDYSSRFDLVNSVKAVGSNLVVDLKQAVSSGPGAASTGSTAFDWDFGANYHINFDAGIVTNIAGLSNTAVTDSTTLNFTTVTPANDLGAVLSQKMDVTGASSTLSNSSYWISGNQSANDGAHSKTVIDLSGKDVAVVVDSNGGTSKSSNMQTFIQLNNFGVGDNLYLDNHGDMALATTDGQGLGAASWGSGTYRAIGDSGSTGGTGNIYFYKDSGTTIFGATNDTFFETIKWLDPTTPYNAVIFG